MKKIVIIALTTLVAFGLGYWTATIKQSVDEKFDIVSEAIEASNQKSQEKFDDFIYKFIGDSLYQLDRIKFPLRSAGGFGGLWNDKKGRLENCKTLWD